MAVDGGSHRVGLDKEGSEEGRVVEEFADVLRREDVVPFLCLGSVVSGSLLVGDGDAADRVVEVDTRGPSDVRCRVNGIGAVLREVHLEADAALGADGDGCLAVGWREVDVLDLVRAGSNAFGKFEDNAHAAEGAGEAEVDHVAVGGIGDGIVGVPEVGDVGQVLEVSAVRQFELDTIEGVFRPTVVAVGVNEGGVEVRVFRGDGHELVAVGAEVPVFYALVVFEVEIVPVVGIGIGSSGAV